MNAYLKITALRVRGTPAEGLDHMSTVRKWIDEEMIRVLQYSSGVSPSMHFEAYAQQRTLETLMALQHQQVMGAPLAVSNALQAAEVLQAPTVGELGKRYLAELEASSLAGGTLRNKKQIFDSETGGLQVAGKPLCAASTSILDVTRAQLVEWLNATMDGLADGTKSNRYVEVQSFFKWIADTQNIRGYINPAVSLKPKAGKAAKASTSGDSSRRWTDAQLATILPATKSDTGGWLIRIMAYTGLRIDEAAQLHKADCTRMVTDDGEAFYSLTIAVDEDGTKKLKTGAAVRTVILGMPQRYVEEFTAWLEGVDGHIFPKLKRNPIKGYTDAAAHQTKKILTATVPDARRGQANHSFRHAFVDRCEKSKMPLKLIKRVVGHSQGDDVTLGTYTSDYTPAAVYKELKAAGIWEGLLED
nr:tyrosine-type recombinase/integrase [Chromobacterium sp. ASV5]